MNRRIDDLFTYLNLLRKLHEPSEGYLCSKEISECITEIRRELFVRKVEHDVLFGKVEWDLSEVPTAQLTDELAKREGVNEYTVDAHVERALINFYRSDEVSGSISSLSVDGPARIIVNKD